jgi:hypothetical protein
MTLDPQLLDQARQFGDAVDEAERQALVARADYHTAIRRLHLAGGPLREIAQALAVSHQRVQQIVSGAGGSWWRRAWRTRTLRPDAVCTWCGRPPSEVEKLVAGPAVYICDGCVTSAERAAGGRAAGGFVPPAARRAAGRCAFCRRRASTDRTLVPAPAGAICTTCLATCREIVDGGAAASTAR